MPDNMKKVAAINDLSGYGRASLTTIIPTMSSMGIQVCPLPTAILSNHTGGFESYSYVDFTENMEDYILQWKKIGIHFDCIYTGFLGSGKQVDIISNFIDDFRTEENMVVVDPVMGDDGSLYTSYNWDFVPLMRKLISKADIITPNFTESAFLLGLKETPERISREDTHDWLKRLSEAGPKVVVITSVPDSEDPSRTDVVAYNREDGNFWKIGCHYIPASYPGTGDLFTSVMTGCLLQGENLPVALDRSVQFISQCIKASFGFDYPKRDGVLLEKELGLLRKRTLISDYEKF